EEACEFPGNGGDGFLVGLAARRQDAIPPVQAVLSLPGDLKETAGLILLPLAELLADFGWLEVMLCCFDQDPTHVSISAFRDAAFADGVATGVFTRQQPKVGHQLARMRKP